MKLFASLLLLFAVFASAGAEAEELSGLSWSYRIGDAAGEVRTLDPAALPEIASGDVIVLTTELSASRVAAYKRPALLVHSASDAEAASVDGKPIGRTGTIIRSARQYSGLGFISAPRLYRLGPLPADGMLTIELKQQWITNSGLARTPRLTLGEAEDLERVAGRQVAAIWVRDLAFLTAILVGAIFSLALTFGIARLDRNRWLPAFLICSIPTAIADSLPAHQLGLAGPGLIWTAELIPYMLFGLMHVASAFGIRMDRASLAALAVYYAILLGILIADLPIRYFIPTANIAYLFVIAAALILLVRAFRTRATRPRASVWTHGALWSTAACLLVQVTVGDVVPPALNPFHWGGIAIVVCLLLAIADDHRRARRSLARRTGQVLVAQDEERERLARDLHDGLSHRIASTRLRLEALFYRKADLDREALAEPIEDLVSIGMDVSGTVENLRPATLSPLTFSDTIEHAVDRWRAIVTPEITLRIDGDGRLSDEVQTQVFRIFQEALHNAIRHAEADRIDVEARLGRAGGRLVIADDGRGFDVSGRQSGVGISSMRERAELIGATLALTSRPGRGTRVELEFRDR